MNTIYYSPSNFGIMAQIEGVIYGPLRLGQLGTIVADNPQLAAQSEQAIEDQELFGEPLPNNK